VSILKFSGTANPKACADNVRYITRERACADISFYNLDELRGDDQRESRTAAIAYGEQRKEEEARHRSGGGGTPRNHHRMILSWDRTESTEQAREMSHEFLRENFPNSRAIVAVHQDKEGQTHTHVWLDCRTQELGRSGKEKKLQLDKATYKTLDERWAQKFDREYGTRYADDYRLKKDETRQFKQRAAERGKTEGKQPRPIDKPERARDRMAANDFREKDIRDLGVERNGTDERTVDRDQRFDTGGQRDAAVSVERNRTADRAIDRSVETIERAEQGTSSLDRIADETVRETEKLHSRFSEMGERSHSLEHDRDRDHSRGR
jgi:hypothetical protein